MAEPQIVQDWTQVGENSWTRILREWDDQVGQWVTWTVQRDFDPRTGQWDETVGERESQTPSKFGRGGGADGGGSSTSLDALREAQRQAQLASTDIAQAQLKLEQFESERRDARDKRDYDRLVDLDGKAENQRQIVNDLNQKKYELDKQINELTMKVAVAGITGEFDGMPTIERQKWEKQLGLDEGALTGYFKGVPTMAREQFEQYLDLARGNTEEAKRQFDIETGFSQRLDAAKFQFEVEQSPVSFTRMLFALSGQEPPLGDEDIVGQLRPYDPQTAPRGAPGTATGAPRVTQPTVGVTGPAQPQVGGPSVQPGYVSSAFPQGISQEQYAGLEQSGVIPSGVEGLTQAGFTFDEQTGIMSASPEVTSGIANRASQALGGQTTQGAQPTVGNPDQEAAELAEQIRKQFAGAV